MMAVIEVEIDIELAIHIYQALQQHPGVVPSHVWELRARIDDAAHAIVGPLANDYLDGIVDVLAIHPFDQAQNHLGNGASDQEVAATWWLLYRGHLHVDHA